MTTLPTQFTHVWKYTKNYVKFVFILAIIMGICLRFVNLERKLYWSDEAFTSLRISGYTEKELFEQDFQGNLITAGEFRKKYQAVNVQKSLMDTVSGLGREEAQLPPLYFAIARIWSQLFGSDIWIVRLLSVMFSLMAVAGIYGLCFELFRNHLAGQIAALLMSVSPFQVLFAQEARPYSLWTLMILLSGIAILRAMRLQNKTAWLVYSFTVALSLYTFLFSGLVFIGHGLYVFAVEKFKFTKNTTAYLRASILGVICFLPWVLVLIFNVHRSYKGVSWLANRLESSLIQRWIVNLGMSFVDFGDGLSSNLTLLYCLPIALLLTYSVYLMCRYNDDNAKLFVIINTFFMIMFLGSADLVLKGQRSTVTRYMIPFYIGAQVLVTYLFTYKLSSENISRLQKRIWRSLLLLLSILGVISCILISQPDIWWNKGIADNIAPLNIAKNANQKVLDSVNLDVNNDSGLNRKLIISDSDSGQLMSLSHRLDSKINLLFVEYTMRPYNIPKDFDEILVFAPSQGLIDWIKTKKSYKLVPDDRYGQSSFWKLQIIE